MSHHDMPAAAREERAREAADAGDERRAAFAAGTGAAEQRTAPGFDRGARDRGPGAAFPGAEIELEETRVETRAPARGVRRKGVREHAAAAGRARPDDGTRQERQPRRQRRRDIEAPVADPADARGGAVAEKEDDQPRRAGTQATSARPSSLRWRAATNSRSDSRLR